MQHFHAVFQPLEMLPCFASVEKCHQTVLLCYRTKSGGGGGGDAEEEEEDE